MSHPSFLPIAGRNFLLTCTLALFAFLANAQPLTGVWRGKIKKNGIASGSEQVELKLVRDGDSLFGAAYYYHDPSRYERVPVRGYVDPWTGTVKFWEDGQNGEGHRGQLVFETDYNCPGEGVLMLDGEAGPRSDPGKKDVTAHFQKVAGPQFEDDWDALIADPSLRMNDGERPGDMYRRLYAPGIPVKDPPVAKTEKQEKPPRPAKTVAPAADVPVAKAPTPAKTAPPMKPIVPATPQEMLESRSRRLVAEIPVTGDSLELAFYDNAEIDGDSIALFMNGKLMYAHVLLKATAFIVKIPMADLAESNEMVMVAENQGSIPPNTSLMVTYVDGKRYEATLESTEGSSAMIRFYKPSGAGPVKPRG